ncbi:hypothetical protein Tco_1096572 [Tanacetum coccineum]
MFRAMSSRNKVHRGYDQLVSESTADDVLMDAKMLRSTTLPANFFGKLPTKFVPDPEGPAKVVSVEKQVKKASKFHPLFSLFERRNRKKKATARPDFSSITDIKSTLTLKALKKFCEAYHIPEVHPQIPTPNQMIHEMLAGKIGVYTRLLEYANFWLPLTTFLVNMLKHYRIYISQLSVLGAAKVSHFEILCRVHGFEPTVGLFLCFYVNSKNKGWVSFSKRPGNIDTCYTKPLDSLKNCNDRFFWVDAFAYPASFSWNASKTMSKDPFPKSSQYNAEHYATLVAYPAPFHKYPKPFLCLVGISRYYTLDENTYP